MDPSALAIIGHCRGKYIKKRKRQLFNFVYLNGRTSG